MKACLPAILFAALLLPACRQPSRRVDTSASARQKVGAPSRLRVLPLGNIRPAVTKQLMDTLRTYLDGIELMKPESMPAMAYYAPRKRYRADSLIHWMARRAAAGETWLGITEQDISTTKEGNPDYGIMGLGFRPGKAAVASNYRLRKKDQFYKVAIHELGHTLGLPHCGDESCYMRDAEGGDPTAHEKYFCTACQAFLKKKGWKR